METRQPSEQDCQRVINNPQFSFPIFAPIGRDTYETDWVYISILSPTGCTVTLTLVFKDDKQRRNTATGGQQKAEQLVTNVDENLILL